MLTELSARTWDEMEAQLDRTTDFRREVESFLSARKSFYGNDLDGISQKLQSLLDDLSYESVQLDGTMIALHEDDYDPDDDEE
jgi:hypothetical protein